MIMWVLFACVCVSVCGDSLLCVVCAMIVYVCTCVVFIVV